MHLVGYLYEDYHDARSLEHKSPKLVLTYVRLLLLLFTDDLILTAEMI